MLTFTNPDIEHIALNRRESLLHHLTHPLPKPDAPPLASLTPRDRFAYDQARMDYLSGGLVLSTTAVTRGQLLLTRAFQENRARNSGHAGVMLSGPSSMGKTTTAKRLMRWVLSQYDKQVPDWRELDHVPVMYVEVTDKSPKSFLQEMAAFFGLSVANRDSTADLRTKVVAAVRRARTQLIVVDELHNLAASRAAGLGETIDLLKGLHNDIAATFLYCGIDLPSTSLMNGPRGQQLNSRFAMLELEPYVWSHAPHRKAWKALIRNFENQLQLHDHPEKSLDADAEYLWQRTGGSIGSLSRLLTGAAIDLIQNGAKVELLTRDILDGYTLDRTAEAPYKATMKRRERLGMTAMERVMQP